jgi:hypothetical protein
MPGRTFSYGKQCLTGMMWQKSFVEIAFYEKNLGTLPQILEATLSLNILIISNVMPPVKGFSGKNRNNFWGFKG